MVSQKLTLGLSWNSKIPGDNISILVKPPVVNTEFVELFVSRLHVMDAIEALVFT